MKVLLPKSEKKSIKIYKRAILARLQIVEFLKPFIIKRKSYLKYPLKTSILKKEKKTVILTYSLPKQSYHQQSKPTT